MTADGLADHLRLPLGAGRWQNRAQYAAFAFLLFGAKLWLIGEYGNASPFWDQWDAEAAFLYKPFLEGSLRWTDLIAPP